MEVIRRSAVVLRRYQCAENEFVAEELSGSLTCREQDVARLAAKGCETARSLKRFPFWRARYAPIYARCFKSSIIDRRIKLADKLKRQ